MSNQKLGFHLYTHQHQQRSWAGRASSNKKKIKDTLRGKEGVGGLSVFLLSAGSFLTAPTTFKSTEKDSSPARWSQLPPEPRATASSGGCSEVGSKIGREGLSVFFSTVDQDVLEAILLSHFFTSPPEITKQEGAAGPGLPPAWRRGRGADFHLARPDLAVLLLGGLELIKDGSELGLPDRFPRLFLLGPTASEQSRSAYANVN